MNTDILFIDSAHPRLMRMLQAEGYNCVDGSDFNSEEIEGIIHQYTVVIVRSRLKVDKDFIDRATRLEFIGRVGAGMDSIDVDYAAAKGIACFNSPEGNRVAVGEHALGMLIALMNHFLRADKQVRQGLWPREANRGGEIKGKTIGIIGYGNMGGAFAQRLSGFDARVIAYDKYKTNYSNPFVKEETLEAVFEKADILSLHVPLTAETRYMVNEEFISKFKKDFWLINTSRGAVVNTVALVNALEKGKIKGAALDVVEYEDTSFENLQKGNLQQAWQYLVKSDKVILTPHIAGWTEESKVKLAEVLAEKIIGFLKGRG